MRLTDLLAQKPVLLADGATGTNLFEMGLLSGDPPEIWNIEHPDRIHALHQSFRLFKKRLVGCGISAALFDQVIQQL